MPITALYAAVAALFLIALSILTIRARRRAKIALGTGKNDVLLARHRAHANFAEYTPMVLLLMALAESMSAPQLALHAVGGLWLAGRLLHANALYTKNISRRVLGMALTFTSLATGALVCAALAITKLMGS